MAARKKNKSGTDDSRPSAYMEMKRKDGYALLSKHMPVSDVAERIGVHRVTVQRWKSRMQKQGDDSWRKVRQPGKQPKLSRKQQKKLTLISARSY